MLVFFDDFLIYNRTWEKHLQQIETVLRILQEQQFYAKLSKCEFGLTEMLYLGHIIGVCCRTDWHDNARTGGCHSDPRSLRLSLSPAAKGGSPCEMMRPTVDQLVGRHEIRYKKDAMALIN